MKKKILLVGWHLSESTDYSKWPDLNAEKLNNDLVQEKDILINEGHDAKWLYLRNINADFDMINKTPTDSQYDCFLIGVGVRLDSSAFITFERLINTIHTASPNAKICFNTNLTDIAEAVKRWI